MQKRIPLARTIGLAILLMGIMILQGCSSSDSAASSDANNDYPYLTGQPTASPSTAVDGDTVNYTVLATGPLGLGMVTAALSPFSVGTGFGNQASVGLTETGTDTWTGAGTINSAEPLLLVGDGYYLFIELVVDPTGVDGTGTIYTRSTSGTKYTYSHSDSAFVQVETGLSAYDVVRVNVQ